jgi:hypothetical protein
MSFVAHTTESSQLTGKENSVLFFRKLKSTNSRSTLLLQSTTQMH